MNLVIVGDSFSSDENTTSWVTKLSNDHSIINLSRRGISEYRIYKIVKDNLSLINNCDCLILWHTNPDRIYVNDEISFPTRSIKTHPVADLVANDSLSSNDLYWRNTVENYYKTFFDIDQQTLYHHLLIKEMRNLLMNKHVLEYTGFQLTVDNVRSFFDTRVSNPGNINHFDIIGNQLIFEQIKFDRRQKFN